jgi:hypothetical protein
MSGKDVDRLHSDRVDAIMKKWGDNDSIEPKDLFISERVAKTIAGDKNFLPSYDTSKILASIPFSPTTYVLVCPACITSNNFAEFQALSKSGLVIPVVLSQYKHYPDSVRNFFMSVDHVSTHEYHAYRFARLKEQSSRGVCAHCAELKIKKIVSNAPRKKGATELRQKARWLAQNLYPFLYPDYTLLDQATIASKNNDASHLDEITRLAETIYKVRSAQALSAPLAVSDEALSHVPAGISTDSDDGLRHLAEMRKMAADGLGLTFPADIPIERYIELAKDYQPEISRIVEYTQPSSSIAGFAKRIASLNSEIERIQGLKRYVMLEASIAVAKQHKGLAFTAILAGTLGTAGLGWLGCGGGVAAGAAIKLAKKKGFLGRNKSAERLGRMIERDLQPYLSKLIAAYAGSEATAVSVLFLRKKIREKKAA